MGAKLSVYNFIYVLAFINNTSICYLKNIRLEWNSILEKKIKFSKLLFLNEQLNKCGISLYSLPMQMCKWLCMFELLVFLVSIYGVHSW